MEGSATRAKVALSALTVMALAALAVAGFAIVQGRVSHATRSPARQAAVLSVDARHPQSATISPLLFGLGVDLSAATYHLPSDTQCVALAGAAGGVTLVRIGAARADDYDWRTDYYYDPLNPRRRTPASFGCFAPPSGAGATVLRVLDRVRALGAGGVVVLNGEIDDPQAAAGLARLAADRYGLAFARHIYWEIGNAPAQWQHYGMPLSERRPDEHVRCSPDQYAALVTSYAAALSAALGGVDPLIVADEWIANATDQSWTGVVTAVDTQYYPFDSPDNSPASAAAIARSVSPLDGQLDSLSTNLAQYQQGQSLPLFVGQWNIDASSPAFDDLYGSSAQAVFVARLLVHLARPGHHVTMAAWASPLYTSPQAPFTASGAPRPGFRVLTALRVLAGAHVLSMGETSGLDGLAARLLDGRVVVLLINVAIRGAALHLHVAGIAPHPIAAVVQTFSPASPDGATITSTVTPAELPVRVPALGVTLVTLPR